MKLHRIFENIFIQLLGVILALILALTILPGFIFIITVSFASDLDGLWLSRLIDKLVRA